MYEPLNVMWHTFATYHDTRGARSRITQDLEKAMDRGVVHHNMFSPASMLAEPVHITVMTGRIRDL